MQVCELCILDSGIPSSRWVLILGWRSFFERYQIKCKSYSRKNIGLMTISWLFLVSAGFIRNIKAFLFKFTNIDIIIVIYANLETQIKLSLDKTT